MIYLLILASLDCVDKYTADSMPQATTPFFFCFCFSIPVSPLESMNEPF